jgi:hypothetical protein
MGFFVMRMGMMAARERRDHKRKYIVSFALFVFFCGYFYHSALPGISGASSFAAYVKDLNLSNHKLSFL